jgi:hypothetical protein
VGKWVYIRVNNQWTSFWKSPNTGCHRDGVIHRSHVFTQEYVIFASWVVFWRVSYFSKEFRSWFQIQSKLTILVKPSSYDIFMC